MIMLDYQTNNPRWGWSGIGFNTWNEYAKVLGFLANSNHYRNISGLVGGQWGESVELHIEKNDIQGAWGKEGRIQYYRTDASIKDEFPELYSCKSAGNGGITYRFNSNDYMYSLVYDYGFEVVTYIGYSTADIFPPRNNAYFVVWNVLKSYLDRDGLDSDSIKEYYDMGWNL